MKRTAAALATAVLCSCTTFSEKHYFRSHSPDPGAVPNYYRVTVSGYTCLSSSRYLSGYFDEQTLDAYFNEFSQPAGGALRPASTSANQPSAGHAVQPLGTDGEGKALVLVLSTNSDEVANQIGALASSRQFTASLAALVGRRDFSAASAAERRLALDRALARTTADLGATLITAAASPGAPMDVVEGQLRSLVNALATDLGYQGASFATLEEAARWVEARRARLREVTP